jgi:hypothetical protein
LIVVARQRCGLEQTGCRAPAAAGNGLRTARERHHDVVTTVVWKDDKALETAPRAVPEKLQALGINPE